MCGRDVAGPGVVAGADVAGAPAPSVVAVEEGAAGAEVGEDDLGTGFAEEHAARHSAAPSRATGVPSRRLTRPI